MKLKRKVIAYLDIQGLFPKKTKNIYINKIITQMEFYRLKWLFGRQMNLCFKATQCLTMTIQKTEEEEAWPF